MDISKISLEELTVELLEEYLLKIKASNKKRVITPITLLQLNGAPVADQTWLLNEKSRRVKLKSLLTQLEEKGVLMERKSKQDFKGIKETGYDIV